MTDVLISYARFLEVRTRRLEIAAELLQPDVQPTTTNVTTLSAPVANDEPPRVGVRVLATGLRLEFKGHAYASAPQPVIVRPLEAGEQHVGGIIIPDGGSADEPGGIY